MDESKKILNTEDWKVHLAFVHSEVMISGWLYWLTGNVDTPQMDHGASREQITIGKQTQLNDFMAEDSDVEVDNLAKTWDFCLDIAGLSCRHVMKQDQKPVEEQPEDGKASREVRGRIPCKVVGGCHWRVQRAWWLTPSLTMCPPFRENVLVRQWFFGSQNIKWLRKSGLMWDHETDLFQQWNCWHSQFICSASLKSIELSSVCGRSVRNQSEMLHDARFLCLGGDSTNP